MAKNIELTLSLTIDGQPVRNFPLRRRITVDELQTSSTDTDGSAGFDDIPDGALTTGQFLLLSPQTQNVSVRFSDGAAGADAFTVNAGGLLLVLDGSWANGVETDDSGNATVLDVQVGGT